MVREAEGMEGFKVHVQIIENDWDRRLGSIEGDRVVFACFFLSLTAHVYHKPYHSFPVNVAPAPA